MPVYIVAPEHAHTHTIIFLHGRDSTAEEFAAELFESQASDYRFLRNIFPSIRWVFPSARSRVSARFGGQLSQWFDIWACESPQERKELQHAGIKDSLEELEEIIADEVALLEGKANCIFLAGISQGCSTTVLKLLTCTHQQSTPFAGLIGFSSWLPFQAEIGEYAMSKFTLCTRLRSQFRLPEITQSLAQATASALETPVFLNDDTVVPIENGEALERSLRELGMNVKWRRYQKGGHWIHEPVGVDDMVAFIKACMGLNSL